MAQNLSEMKCKNCGAPIQYVAGENVLHCSYCGSTIMVASLDNIVKVEEHFIIPNTQSNASVQQHCHEWMGKGFFKAKDLPKVAVFDKIQGFYLPFWVVHAQVNTYWAGMNERTRTVRYGNQTRTETYWEPANGSFDEVVGWVIYARTNMDEYYGLSALNPGAQATTADWGGFSLGMGLGSAESKGIDLTTGKVAFQAELAKSLNIINGQITQNDANERAKAQVTGYHHRKAEKKVTRLTSCNTTIQIEKTELIYAPLWFVSYNYKGKNYRMLLEGHGGTVISGEAPVGKWDKVVISSVIGGVVAVGCGLGAHYINQPWAPYLFIGSAIAIIAVGIHAIITALSRD
jgi:DNA-directed RNA polymerase subunit RPC12/RpoP